MAGLGTALAYAAAGMAEGWGKGQMDAIKQTREEKLRQLELDRAERMEGQRQKFQGEQSAMDRAQQAKLAGAQLAATKENTMAQLGVQERIAKMNEAGQNTRTDKTIAATRENLGLELAARKDNLLTSEGAQTARNDAQIKAQTDIQDKQLAFENLKGTTVQPYKNEAGEIVYQAVDATGKPVPDLVMPDGTKLSPLPAADDTPQITNYKYMASIPGFDPKQAAEWAFGAKSKDLETIETTLLNGMVSASLTPPNANKMKEFRQMAHDGAVGIIAGSGGADVPAAPAVTPTDPAAATTATPEIKLDTPEKQQQAMKLGLEAIKQGKDKKAVIAKLNRAGIHYDTLRANGF